MKLVLSSVFVLFTASLASAQIPDSQRSSNIVNGRWWIVQDSQTQVGYLMGFEDGNNDALFANSATYGEVARGVTLFYREPANGRIPLPAAVFIFFRKFHGATPAEIESMTVWARTGKYVADEKCPPSAKPGKQ